MGRSGYPNPPITEAICQFEFAEKLPWTVVTPALVYQKLATEYPLEPDQQEQVQAVFGPSSEGLSPEFSINRSANRYIYRDDTRSRLVVLSPTTISVSSLRPYEGWPSLLKRGSHAVRVLQEIVAVPDIKQVSLRYINQIRLGAGVVDLDDYVTIPVQAAAFDGAAVSAFVNRTESILPDGTRVNITFASVAPPSGDDQETANVILDIDCLRQYAPALTVDDALTAADELKTIENQQFEALITDECRRLFT